TGNPGHRQDHGREHPRSRSHGYDAPPRRAPDPLQANDARAPPAARHGPEDRGDALLRTRHCRHRRTRGGCEAGRPPYPARMGQRFTDKLIKGIEDHRKNASRFRIDVAKEHADRISALIREFPGIDTIIPAGSLRRGRESVGDLDLLVTGPACEPEVVAAAVEHVAALPLIDKLLAKGQNKVSFTLRNNLQVDVRLLPRASYGAALQYFSGSKHHNVALRQRAIKRGLTLSEYALLRLEDNTIVAAASEAEIYNALDLDYTPPELRETCGKLAEAAKHT